MYQFVYHHLRQHLPVHFLPIRHHQIPQVVLDLDYDHHRHHHIQLKVIQNMKVCHLFLFVPVQGPQHHQHQPE
jgi:hypothetical protein